MKKYRKNNDDKYVINKDVYVYILDTLKVFSLCQYCSRYHEAHWPAIYLILKMCISSGSAGTVGGQQSSLVEE